MTVKRGWSYSAGERGRSRVRGFEHPECGILFVEYYERHPTTGRLERKRVSLGHRDRREARRQVDRMAATMLLGQQVRRTEIPLTQLFDIYEEEVSETKGRSKRSHDKRAARMFTAVFGGDRTASTLNLRDVHRFVALRRAGKVGPNPNRLRPVGDRQVEYDLKYLMAVLRWATNAKEQGQPLLERNPLIGVRLPKEVSPHRPKIGDCDYRAILAAAQSLDWRFRVALVLAHETGHRVGAISGLRWSDLDLRGKRVRWCAARDKAKREHWTPLTKNALDALKVAREHCPALGEAWLLPSPRKPETPLNRDTLAKWFRKAAALAGLKLPPRAGFHSLRRKFATELKHVPLPDLCALGGWSDPKTILTCYQEPDEQTMRAALTNRVRLGIESTHQSTHPLEPSLEANQ